MLATAIILFRESLEAALIITIVLSATRGLTHRTLWVLGGVAVGLLGSLIVAQFAQQISNMAAGTGQELFNAGVLLTAVGMLGWHNVWMAKHGREIAAQMSAVGKDVSSGERHMSALALVVALAVLREGSEVVLFMTGLFAGGTSVNQAWTGGLLGVLGGAGIGVLLYWGLVRIPMRYFFSVTSWMILLLAAGLAAQAAGFLVQAGYLPALIDPLWNSGWLLQESSWLGQILHTLVGYSARPSAIQLIFYVVTIAIIGVLMVMTQRNLRSA